MAYEHTSVDIMKSWSEICKVLYSHGCEATRYTETPQGFIIEFLRTKPTKHVVKMPVQYNFKGLDTSVKREQEKRTKWRSLFYYIKAVFDAIDKGIVTIEQAFLADTVLMLNGESKRAIEFMLPSVASGHMDPFVPLLEAPKEQEAQTVEYRLIKDGA